MKIMVIVFQKNMKLLSNWHVDLRLPCEDLRKNIKKMRTVLGSQGHEAKELTTSAFSECQS